MSSYITTYTGKHFEPTNPDQEAICIGDIAHALSLITRGNGHVKTFWSVGEHCLCCAKEAAARGLSDRLILACLLHDASECYMSDIPRPFKRELPEYCKHENHLLDLIYEKFLGDSLTAEEQVQLKAIDCCETFCRSGTGVSGDVQGIFEMTAAGSSGNSQEEVLEKRAAA